MNLHATLQEERARIHAAREVGTACRACTQDCKVYTRKLTAERARELRRLLLLQGRAEGRWVHRREFVTNGGGDYAKMALWGLIEEHPPEAGVATNGYWRLTVKGLAFLRMQTRVTQGMRVYLGRALGPIGKLVTYLDVLADPAQTDTRRWLESMKEELREK